MTLSISGVSSNGALPTLDMFEQRALERRALRILAMAPVRQEIECVEALFRQNWLADTADGSTNLVNAVARYAMLAIQMALLDDPARPKFMWTCNLPHDWFGVHWPGAGWGLDNPDNFYRYLFVDGTSRYEISGQRRGPGPAQQSYLLYSSIPGTAVHDIEGATVIASRVDSDFHVASDGSFKMTIGPEPAAPGANHVQTSPDAKVIFIRDTLGDWSKEFPHRLSIRRVSGPPAPPPKSDTELAERAAALLATLGAYWLRFWQTIVYDHPVNVLRQPVGRSGRWGGLSNVWFKLQPDECLVITADALRAGYFAAQIADPWSITPDYSRYTCGLNRTQAKSNADGTYTFVIAARDPGVWNWIDTRGLHLGLLLLRWQDLADDAPPLETAVRESRVVKIGDLQKQLSADAAWATPAQRERQRADRAAAYALRVAN